MSETRPAEDVLEDVLAALGIVWESLNEAERVKATVIIEADRKAVREECAKVIEDHYKHEICRYVDRAQDICDCPEYAAAIRKENEG